MIVCVEAFACDGGDRGPCIGGEHYAYAAVDDEGGSQRWFPCRTAGAALDGGALLARALGVPFEDIDNLYLTATE